MGAAAPRKYILPQPLSLTVPGIKDKCLLATYYRIAGFHMSPWLYKCSEQAHLAHNYTLQFGYHVFSTTHSAQTLSYTRFNPVDLFMATLVVLHLLILRFTPT
jgi:hypothetical protein